ncbi:MazG-like family protein [Mammaliicoccus lentus]|uniref:MazG-like family protein n=1 Tax=Mammaliicoccus lentus TaxID=42858 RepID=A0ABS6GW19_MAMLE|nr:MazG-like family protein [Mammaliicoccus lentus]MBU6112521.1 MazG-like family protein [Mammaliicoccus lentus]
MNELIKQVEQWSKDKNLDQGNSFSQFAKSAEELGEVASALCRNDKDLLRDGIGDVVVTLIILAQQNGMDLHECLNTAYDEIKGRTGVTTEDGRFIKESDL